MYPPLRCEAALFEKDLSGTTCLVTGANSGVGLETTRQLVRQGARVVMACRRVEAGQAAAQTMAGERGSTEVMHLDLGDLASVRRFAEAFLEKYARLDALVNNAGLVTTRLTRTADGFEQMFGVNHLGPFLLTELLLGIVKESAPARIVILSSVVHAGRPGKRVALDFDDLNFQSRPFSMTAGYAQSKLAGILYAQELAGRLEGTGVSVFSVHPGWARSNLGSNIPGMGVMKFVSNVVLRPFARRLTLLSNQDAAQTSLHCLLDDEAPRHSGEYFSQNSILYADKECRGGGWPMRSPNENAYDEHMAQRLVDTSRSLVS